MKVLHDTWLMYRRSLILTLRQPVWVAMGLFQPILYLFLFAPAARGRDVHRRRVRERLQLVRPRSAHPDGLLRGRSSPASGWSPRSGTASSSGCG